MQRDGYMRTEVIDRKLPDVDTVDRHASPIGIVEPQQQGHQRRLARAAAADYSGDGAGANGEVDALQHRQGGVVGEVHGLPGDRGDRRREGSGLGRIDDVGFHVQQMKCPFEAHEEILQPAPGADEPCGAEECPADSSAGVLEGAEVPDRETDHRCRRRAQKGLPFIEHPVNDDVFRADEDRRSECRHDDVQLRDAHPQQKRRIKRPVRVFFEPSQYTMLALVRLDDTQRHHRLLQVRGQVAVGDPVLQGPRAHPWREPGSEHDHRQKDERAYRGNARIEKGDEDQRDDDPVESDRRIHEGLLNQAGDRGTVLVHAEHRIAHGGPTVKAARKVLRLGDHRDPQILVDHLPDRDQRRKCLE